VVIVLMVDSVDQVILIDNIINTFNDKPARKLNLCIDLDVSYKPFSWVHLGALRSSCRSLALFKGLCEKIKDSKNLCLCSVMGYEAQIGVPDNKPKNALMNTIMTLFKSISFADVCKKRALINQFLQQTNTKIQYFNGGGTGTLTKTMNDPVVTEVTVGSAFLHAHLFDKFKDKTTSCAFIFGLRVTREPSPGIVTCQSGGFIASGPVSESSAPTVFLPQGLVDDPNEGFGEVQTPLHTNGASLKIGDPVFFRACKSGEIAERFNKYILLEKGEVVGEEPTYRGLQQAFY